MTTPCKICLTDSNSYLCGRHIDYLRDALSDLAWLLSELNVTIAKQDKLHQVNGRSEQSTRSVFNSGASQLRDDVQALLAKSLDIVLDDLGASLPNKAPAGFIGPLPRGVHRMSAQAYSGDPRSMAVFLAHHVNVLANRETVKDFFFEVINLTGNPDTPSSPGRLVSAINRRSKRFAGPCPTVRGYDQHGVEMVCNTPLYVYDDSLDDKRLQTVTCGKCQQTVNVAENQLRAATNRDLMPEKAVADWMETLGEPVPLARLKDWVTHKRLAVHGYLHRGEIVPTKEGYHSPRVISLTQARALRSQMDQEQLTQASA